MRISHSLALVGSLQFGVSGPVDGHVYALRGPAGIVLIDAGGGTHTERILQPAGRPRTGPRGGGDSDALPLRPLRRRSGRAECLFPGHGRFTLRGGQRHLDCAIAQAKQNFLPRQMGQWELIF